MLLDSLQQSIQLVQQKRHILIKSTIFHAFRPSGQLTNSQANKSHIKPAQIIKDAKNDPCSYKLFHVS
jgi:hypothetical protein